MVRFIYSHGLTVVYLACGFAGMLVGSGWGVSGMILGVTVGASAASGFAYFIDQSEGRENMFFSVLSVLFIVAIAWFIPTLGSLTA